MVTTTNPPSTVIPGAAAVDKALLRQWMNEVVNQTNAEMSLANADRVANIRDAGVLELTGIAGSADAISAQLYAPLRDRGIVAGPVATVLLVPAGTNTGTVTLSIDGGAAMAVLRQNGSALVAGDLVAGIGYLLRRRGASWRIIGGDVTSADMEAERLHRRTSTALGASVLLSGLAGTANEITAEAPTGITNGGVAASNLRTIQFFPIATNTGHVTIDIGGTGAVGIFASNNAQLAAGALKAGFLYSAVKFAGRWRLQSGDVTLVELATERADRMTSVSAAGVHTLQNVAGMPNAVTGEFPVGISLAVGMTVLLWPGVANTGAVTLTIPGPGTRDVRNETGGLMVAGDLQPGRAVQLAWMGSVWRVVSSRVSTAEFRALQTSASAALDRQNHTGQQPIATVRGLDELLSTLGLAAGAATPDDPRWNEAQLALMADRSLVNITARSAYQGSAAEVTSIQAGGRLGANFAIQDAGLAAIQWTPAGFVFNNGAWLRAIIPAGLTYDRLLMVVDLTPLGESGASANTAVVSTNLGNMTIDGATRLMFKVPSANVAYDAPPVFFGQRQIVAATLDATARVARIWNTDGQIVEAPSSTSTPQQLTDARIGRLSACILHRVMIFAIPATEAGFPIDPDHAWHRAAVRRLRTRTAIELGWGWGQSIYQSWPVPTDERWALNQGQRRDLLMVNGMRTTTGGNVGPTGVGINVIDRAVPATGLAPLNVNNGETILFGLYRRLITRREELGLPSPMIVAGTNGFGGQGAEEFDDDPATGTTSTVLWDNNKYWLEQAIAQAEGQGITPQLRYMLVVHGDAHKTLSRGGYRALFNRTQGQHLALALEKFGYAPKLLMPQNGGDTNTANDGGTGWGFLLDQIDLIKEHSALLIGPQYPYLIGPESPLNVHPDHVVRRAFGELAAEAVVYYERGLDWNLLPPTESEVTIEGNQVILPYRMPHGSSMFMVPEPNKYEAYGGTSATCPNLGFTAPGRTITDVAFSGRTIRVTLDAAPTILKYAMQVQDVVATADASNKGYSAHRGLISTDWRLDSVVAPGMVHRRWLPSYTWTFS